MFWGRVGTRTPRSTSGTVEELNRAIDRNKRTGKPHIMCYFKREGIDPLSIDLEQLKHVQQIHKTLRKSGLIFEFKTIRDFEKKLKDDIILWLERKVITGARPVSIMPRWSSVKPKRVP